MRILLSLLLIALPTYAQSYEVRVSTDSTAEELGQHLTNIAIVDQVCPYSRSLCLSAIADHSLLEFTKGVIGIQINGDSLELTQSIKVILPEDIRVDDQSLVFNTTVLKHQISQARTLKRQSYFISQLL